MKYKLINPINKNYTAKEQVLTNRGIAFEDLENYLHTSDEIDINSPLLLGKDLLSEAVVVLCSTISNAGKTLVIVDSDCDGFTSSAILINYLYTLFPSWVTNNLKYFLHEGKQHGLADVPENLIKQFDLVIIPDASSNDYDLHEKYKKQGIQIIVLDHHEAEHISKNAIIINNQLSDYPNKHLSGAGVTWQFCRFIDSKMNTNHANSLIDLVALGNMADMMSMTSKETKHLINKGFKHIANPFIMGMAEKNSFSLKGKVTPMGAAFYIAPFVNAIVRSGTMEEKELVFKSMLNHEATKKILSNKRGHKIGEEEYLYEQAIRTAVNVKKRQTDAQNHGLQVLEQMIEDQNLLDNKVLLFLLEPGQVDKNIAGLIANKFMAKYQRPCCILTKVEELVETYPPGRIAPLVQPVISYQGSARGCDKADVNNFKDICAEFGEILYAEGHQGAFGLGLAAEKVDAFIAYTNKALKNMASEPTYYVDYIYDGANVNSDNIIEIAEMEYLWGKDLDEPFIAIESLFVTSDMVTLMSPDKKPTLKITLNNGVSLIKFNSSQEEYESFLSSKSYCSKKVSLIGRCNKNEWNGWVTPQILIEDYDIKDVDVLVF